MDFSCVIFKASAVWPALTEISVGLHENLMFFRVLCEPFASFASG